MWRGTVTPVSAPAAAFRFLEIPRVSIDPGCETVQGRREAARCSDGHRSPARYRGYFFRRVSRVWGLRLSGNNAYGSIALLRLAPQAP